MNGLKMVSKSTVSVLGRSQKIYTSFEMLKISSRYFNTPLTTQLRQTDGFEKNIIDRTPTGRWGNPKDLRGTVIFLASPASDFVSGTSIVVDGGMLGR
jgi:NAD(P)-dependent dehydrogenase (short-subunit alcohol dehydrogenase family)